ncbi:hypothetical protein [Pseudomonas sp. LP_7_YM]|uniref:hypothetical protein n=1 Tax=Pseudomonas sp. LP_7_YM TaxID=2485137 RepID=UPI00105F7D3D|nr:hypothetical protein [Pseudomonas sp. LP_7_YM]TDV72662.1 hypothetical protein EC915_101809 [Pseudomonas sp. LP_7_YM]
MPTIKFVLALFIFTGFVGSALARDLSKKERELCTWGAGIANTAQQYKLSGLTLYGARKKLQARHFPQQWMRMSALGITEQTYDSPSRLRPEGVRQVYYEGCTRHELARR